MESKSASNQKQTEIKENSIANQPKTKKTNFLIISQTEKTASSSTKPLIKCLTQITEA
jgi:hypothetical protein